MLRTRLWFVLALTGAIAALAVVFQFVPASGEYAEAATITENVANFKDLSDRFAALADEKGGVYAYEILRRAVLPPNTDVHLLGHAIGDILYTQKGIDGMYDCTQDFRNACSHTIVIGALNEFGEPALDMIRDACRKAPGGSGAYTMCFHGLGHGVFAYYNYEIPETVAFCKKTATKEYNNREYIECVGGMIMELMGGGGHNHDAWLASREKYLTDDPLAPCSTSVIPGDVKGICYTYITPHLFERAGANMAMPQADDIEGAFAYCDAIPNKESKNRYACFSGIGKELPILAVDRDARAINTASDAALARMRDLCRTAPHTEAYSACIESVQDSIFWGGENDVDVSIRFCMQPHGDERDTCFSYLFGIAKTYVPSNERSNFCARMPEEFREACVDTFGL